MKLISGGQSGVDRAVLDAAIERGITHGGWCPKDGWAEDFPDPPGLRARYPNLQETPLAEPAQRTEWNIRDADACLIVVDAGGMEVSRGIEVSRGTALAVELTQRYGKPCFVAELGAPHVYHRTAFWLRGQFNAFGDDLKLAIGGPRESEAPGIYARARDFIGLLMTGGTTTP